MSGRSCYAPDCGASVPPGMLMCREHWYRVPREVRHRVWRAYRNMVRFPEEYLEAINAARDSLLEENR